MPQEIAWRAEISRKVLHVSSGIIPLAYLVLSQDTMLWTLLVLLVLLLLVEFLRHRFQDVQNAMRGVVGIMVRQGEWGRITGSTYVILGSLLTIWLFPKNVAIGAIWVLAISDTAASLIGLRFGRARFLGKSVAGSSAFFLSAVIVLRIAVADSMAVACIGAAVGTIAEALPAWRLGRFETSDNVLIPLMTATAVWLAL